MLPNRSPRGNDEPPDDPVSTKIVRQVAAETGRDVLNLSPLQETIDPDALDAVVESSTPDTTLGIRFTYEGYIVTVDGSGTVTLSSDNK
ncbi:HalOD1 output domain-containing protein [Halorientalis salina]|uniref:HalOD1 output domain-containing protein n=1 Tax=Halorientalis salina TaxID=2932266 RepID=UPI00145CE066|nr:HalOD1 output domain-containing protein [Halorientalis salina]